MLVRVDVIFGMRHQSKDISLRIAYAGNVKDGTIGVDGVFALCGGTVCTNIGQSDLIAFKERRKRKEFRCLKTTLTVGYGTFNQPLQSFCPNAFSRNGFESYPTTFEMSLRIEGKRCDLTSTPIPGANRRSSGKNSCFHQSLKSITDTNYRFASFDKVRDFIRKIGCQIKSKEFTRAQSVCVGEAAGNHKQLKIGEKRSVQAQFVERNPDCICARKG